MVHPAMKVFKVNVALLIKAWIYLFPKFFDLNLNISTIHNIYVFLDITPEVHNQYIRTSDVRKPILTLPPAFEYGIKFISFALFIFATSYPTKIFRIRIDVLPVNSLSSRSSITLNAVTILTFVLKLSCPIHLVRLLLVPALLPR